MIVLYLQIGAAHSIALSPQFVFCAGSEGTIRCVCVCMCACVRACVCLSVFFSVCLSVHVLVCVVCMLCVCFRACVRVFICSVCTHTNMHVHMSMHV